MGQPQRPVVVIATYNERENVEQLLPELLALHPALRIVVVDDASPDGTAQTVEHIARKWPNRIELMKRPGKMGYASAFLAGFEKALVSGAECVVSMDADFSHSPAAVPDLLKMLDEHDVAVGSRYVDGVRILNWSVWRLFLSVFANQYVNWILRLHVQDATSGFRAYRRNVLESIDLRQATSNGYAFLVEILDMVVSSGYSVGEVPIVYEDRQKGQSKMDRRVIFEAGWKPWYMLAKRLRGSRSARRNRPTDSADRNGY